MSNTDTRFSTYGVDGRFPSPGTDTRFATTGVDARFHQLGVDGRFAAANAGFSPLDITGLIGWYDASDASTFTVGAHDVIQQVNNKVPGRLPLVPAAYGAPTYDPAYSGIGGQPAVVWPRALNDLGLTIGEDAMCSEVFMVCQFDDGVTASFPEYVTFITPLVLNGGLRTIGQLNSNRLFGGKRASVNGAAFSQFVLPLPLSVVRFSATDLGSAIQLASIGLRTDVANRSWWGPICEVLAFSDLVTPSNADVEAVEQYLTEKWLT